MDFPTDAYLGPNLEVASRLDEPDFNLINERRPANERTACEICLTPQHEEFESRNMWRLSNGSHIGGSGTGTHSAIPGDGEARSFCSL
jgi:hypothetical protein